VSELRSLIEYLRVESLPELPDVRIEEDFCELQRVGELLEAERLRRLAEIDRRRLFERDGHLSAAAWLVARFRMAWGSARDAVRLARGLEAMPATRRALEAGEVPLGGARALVAAREIDAEAFARAEQSLVDAARAHSVGDLHRVIAYWHQAVEREHGGDGDERLRERRRLHISPSFLGMVRVDGDLDPETGETVLTALRAVIDVETRSSDRRDDRRSPAQRRADALGEVCRQWLDGRDRPVVAGERPHMTITVSAGALQGQSAAELDHTGPVSPRVARRIACDSIITRLVLSGRSEPLDVGRRTPVVSPAIRRAVIARDRTCRFPGCDRPHSWCDAHHIVHWTDGGETAVRNLLLLCRRHHRKVHERGGLTLEPGDGRPVFRRPDGSVLEDRAPP